MPEVLVPTTWVRQEASFLCGPAVVQILLTSLGRNPPVIPPTWQEQIWTDVKANTLEVRPAGAPPGTAANPAWPGQKCEQCSRKDPWRCWSTTPLALERVMNLRQNAATFSAASEATEFVATSDLIATLNLTIAAAALVYGWQHWVVVDGYKFGEANGINVGAVSLNGVYIRNPNALTGAVHFVSAQWWFDRYLSAVPCGTYANHYVVLRAVQRPQAPPAAPTNVHIIR
jgi:hypothetical protein